MAYCSEGTPAIFPDITYGFYSVFADLYGIDAKIIPLSEDFAVVPEEYFALDRGAVIANPNAPTGLVLTVDEIEKIARKTQNVYQ